MLARMTAFGSFFLVLLAAGAAPAANRNCDPDEVAAVRAEAEAQCNCEAAANHGEYVDCVAAVARDALRNGTLTRGCKGAVVRCAAQSTCGRPGFVTCCLPPRGDDFLRRGRNGRLNGGVRCRPKKSAEACEAQGGTVSSCPSCCDACGNGTCPVPGSTTTTSQQSTTTTTSPGGACGNGVLDPGEECDPPGSLTCPGEGSPGGAFTACGATCQCGAVTTSTTTTPTSSTTTTTSPGGAFCGNGVVDPGEQCDPPGSFTCTDPTSPGGALLQCCPDCICATPGSTTTSTTIPGGGTTTTTTPGATTTTVPGATTTTTLPGQCDCCGFGQLQFTTSQGTGNCGSVVNSSGTSVLELSCGGLYFGGGQNSVPLPALVPDNGQSITNITACDPGTGDLTLAGASAAETGSPRNCTNAGCLFGAPLPIPNANSVPTSTCVINSLSANATGTANCATGASSINLPLNSEIFLTGDLLPGVAGIQPCPICTGTCQGGPNDGQNCTPESSDLGDAFPTSHDCPPPAELDIGGLPIPFALTTGTASDTAGPSGTQQRVFCGFCRDQNNLGTGLFEEPGRPCSADADCTNSAFPDCEQRNNGAFSAGAARTISATGTPPNVCLANGPAAGTLVSVFCIPPTFDPTVDNAADLPGPGAVSLPGTTELLP
jgi:hypothetical protein